MANEPGNLVLVRLREIRAPLAEHSARLGRMEAHMTKRFNDVDGRFDEMRSLVGHTVGLSISTCLKRQKLERHQGYSEGEQSPLRGRLEELERRVAKIVEERDQDD